MNPQNQPGMGFTPLPVGTNGPVGYQPPNYSSPGGLVFPGQQGQGQQFPGQQFPPQNTNARITCTTSPYPSGPYPPLPSYTNPGQQIPMNPSPYPVQAQQIGQPAMYNPNLYPNPNNGQMPVNYPQPGVSHTVLQPIIIAPQPIPQQPGSGPGYQMTGQMLMDKKAQKMQKKLEKEQKKLYKKK